MNKQGHSFQIVVHGEPVDACAKFVFKGFQVSMSTMVQPWSDIAVLVFSHCGEGPEVWHGQCVAEALAWIEKESQS